MPARPRSGHSSGMSDASPATPSPAELYEAFFVPALFEPWTAVLLEHAAPRPGERVLDLACGTGVVARAVAAAVGPRGRVVGLDLRPGMLAVARGLPAPAGAPIEWVEGDATAPDLPDETFDLVVCQQGLQFFADRAAALGAVRRLLVPGGRAVVACWLGLDQHELWRALHDAERPRLAQLGVPADDARMPFSLCSADELRGLLAGAGLERVEIIPRSLEVDFPDPDRFVANVEQAYAAVMPQFAGDPAQFETFVQAITRDTAEVVARHRDGDRVRFATHAQLAIAHKPAAS
jgi:SAM-dependent methyltransferase